MIAVSAIMQSAVRKLGLNLTFDDISNAPVANPASVSDWNTFFGLPTYGTPFSDVSVSGNTVKLYGGSGITLPLNFIESNEHLLKFIDNANCVIAVGDGSFSNCIYLNEVFGDAILSIDRAGFSGCVSLPFYNFGNTLTIGNSAFNNFSDLTELTIDIRSCTSLGTTVGDNNVFNGITGKTITITVNSVLLTCNGGNMDGDLQYLVDNNDVTIIPVYPNALNLAFDDIANVPVANANSVSDWNTFFDLPAFGSVFTSVEVSGNQVSLFGGSNITLWGTDTPSQTGIFYNDTHLVSIVDTLGCIVGANERSLDTEGGTTLKTIILNSLVTANDFSLSQNAGVTTLELDALVTGGQELLSGYILLTTTNLPSTTYLGANSFNTCPALETVSIPSCTNLGGTVGDDGVFSGTTGQNITLTVPSALMTCNAGSPDGDIQYLQANNTVTIITV